MDSITNPGAEAPQNPTEAPEIPRWTLKEYDDGYWLRAPGAPDTDMIRLNGSYDQFVRLLKALKEYEAVKKALAEERTCALCGHPRDKHVEPSSDAPVCEVCDQDDQGDSAMHYWVSPFDFFAEGMRALWEKDKSAKEREGKW